jgi:hypothetical protein
MQGSEYWMRLRFRRIYSSHVCEGVHIMGIIQFLASSTGRLVRVVAGVALILLGLFVVQGTGGILLAIVGLVPLLAGVFDFCVFAPLFGMPFKGTEIREL